MTAKDCLYDSTVDESKQRSLEKAMAIFDGQQKEREREVSERVQRPNISVIKGLFVFAVVSVMLFILLPCMLNAYINSLGARMFIVLIISVILFLVTARRIIVWLIRVYQKLAPKELRLACVFEPSCSEYMLMSIEKYGVLYGVIKGIKRLLRCRYPNGGIDNP